MIAADWEGLVAIELSRKNLERLLGRLDNGARIAQITRRDEGGKLLIVVACEDAAHYGPRLSGSSGPGQAYGETHV